MAIATDTELKQREAAYQIELKMRALYDNMLATFTEIFTTVWANPNLTPQQVMDAMGDRAAQMFAMAQLCVATLNGAVPNSVDGTPPLPFTVNNDGTVTVGS